MIIWGSRSRKSVLSSGQFHCPHCATKQPYDQEKMRRWFTLYFIPVIPLNELGQLVTCKTCQKSWEPTVLANDPEKREAELMDRISRAWLTAMSTIAAIGGRPSQQVAEAIVADVEAATGRRFPPEDSLAITSDKAKIPVTQQDVLASLGGLPSDLSTSGRERCVGSAVKILRMVSNCGPEEIAIARAVGLQLGASEAHVKGILLEAGLL